MSEKIYLVTSGSYSDYGIDAAFSTREKAQELIDRLEWDDTPNIEEWAVDELPTALRPGCHLYQVWMDKEGNTDRIEIKEKPTSYEAFWSEEHTSGYWDREAQRWVFTCVARDGNHAIKISNERRTFWIANGTAEREYQR
jgi:hypothetical protein